MLLTGKQPSIAEADEPLQSHPITSSVVSDSHPSPPIPDSNPDENDSLGMASMSHEAESQYIPPQPFLGLDVCQRTHEPQPHKSV